MDQCISAPASNTTELDDTEGLDAPPGYILAMFWAAWSKIDSLFVHQYRVFGYTASDFDLIFGINALALSQITLAEYFGTATVPTTGQAAVPVYIVRMPVFACVIFLLTLVVFLISADLILA